jgi:alpha-tubulin suppressor-like RCC1 family protein
MDLIGQFMVESGLTAAPASAAAPSKTATAAKDVTETETAAKEVTETETADDGDSQPAGRLLIGGCTDWDRATSKNVSGLDSLKLVDIEEQVVRTFSSSTSMTLYILCEGNVVYSMGRNDCGQAAVASGEAIAAPKRVRLPTQNHKVRKIACGRSHSLFLFDNGEVWGCGSNVCGQLGLGGGKNVKRNFEDLTKLPLKEVMDVSAGESFSLCCTSDGKLFSFGHPEYGQLGTGTTGEFIKDGGKGAAVQYSYVTSPQLVWLFLSKDAKGKVLHEYTDIKVAQVSAGKNHAICVESTADGGLGRVFSWGFGGYGRLGHTSASDELYPREIATFAQPSSAIAQGKFNTQKQIQSIYAGSSYTLAIAASKNVYFWGKLSNSPRGEATMYPKVVSEMYDFPAVQAHGGANLVIVSAR